MNCIFLFFSIFEGNYMITVTMKTKIILSFFSLFVFGVDFLQSADCFIEAESFSCKGGWVVDQQFMDQMGSPYLMAHGMGKPVENAVTELDLPQTGKYYVYVRTYNWTSPWSDSEGAGKFKVSVNSEFLPEILGASGNCWQWQKAGSIMVKERRVRIVLHDMTGFNGRCDALYFTTEEGLFPPSDRDRLSLFRKEKLGLPSLPPKGGRYDLVIVGGGIAGISAAISAARLGCRVALVHDRPVLGGNNSSEVRVHLGGRIGNKPYPRLGDLQKEFGPSREGNAQPAGFYEDEKKSAIVGAEENITLFLNYHATEVRMSGNSIASIVAQHIESSREIALEAPLFADCTGDGTIGYLAGAEYAMGRESRAQYGEPTAPLEADRMTMGASVQWYTEETPESEPFPLFRYGIDINAKSAEKVTMGEWTWETGMNYDQISDFERIRDYGLMVVFSNWSYLKNNYFETNLYRNRRLCWVAYIAGKRESRRLMGDHVLTENDLVNRVSYPDASAITSWTIDLHYPDPENTRHFSGEEFKSIAKHIPIHPYALPYRCLYSRNIDNLFMAGRNISVSHVALGTVRVMRTTGIMGEVVGMAASLCKEYGVKPRGIYEYYLPQLKELMKRGVSKGDFPNNQLYNQGSTLGE